MSLYQSTMPRLQPAINKCRTFDSYGLSLIDLSITDFDTLVAHPEKNHPCHDDVTLIPAHATVPLLPPVSDYSGQYPALYREYLDEKTKYSTFTKSFLMNRHAPTKGEVQMQAIKQKVMEDEMEPRVAFLLLEEKYRDAASFLAGKVDSMPRVPAVAGLYTGGALSTINNNNSPVLVHPLGTQANILAVTQVPSCSNAMTHSYEGTTITTAEIFNKTTILQTESVRGNNQGWCITRHHNGPCMLWQVTDEYDLSPVAQHDTSADVYGVALSDCIEGESVLCTLDDVQIWQADLCVSHHATPRAHGGNTSQYDVWRGVHYGSHPRSLLLADTTAVQHIDLRARGSTSTHLDLECFRLLSRFECLRCFTPYPNQPHYTVACTDHRMVVVDDRMPKHMLLEHHLTARSAPQFLHGAALPFTAGTCRAPVTITNSKGNHEGSQPPTWPTADDIARGGGEMFILGCMESSQCFCYHMSSATDEKPMQTLSRPWKVHPKDQVLYSTDRHESLFDATSLSHRINAPITGACVMHSQTGFTAVQLSIFGDIFYQPFNVKEPEEEEQGNKSPTQFDDLLPSTKLSLIYDTKQDKEDSRQLLDYIEQWFQTAVDKNMITSDTVGLPNKPKYATTDGQVSGFEIKAAALTLAEEEEIQAVMTKRDKDKRKRKMFTITNDLGSIFDTARPDARCALCSHLSGSDSMDDVPYFNQSPESDSKSDDDPYKCRSCGNSFATSTVLVQNHDRDKIQLAPGQETEPVDLKGKYQLDSFKDPDSKLLFLRMEKEENVLESEIMEIIKEQDELIKKRQDKWHEHYFTKGNSFEDQLFEDEDIARKRRHSDSSSSSFFSLSSTSDSPQNIQFSAANVSDVEPQKKRQRTDVSMCFSVPNDDDGGMSAVAKSSEKVSRWQETLEQLPDRPHLDNLPNSQSLDDEPLSATPLLFSDPESDSEPVRSMPEPTTSTQTQDTDIPSASQLYTQLVSLSAQSNFSASNKGSVLRPLSAKTARHKKSKSTSKRKSDMGF